MGLINACSSRILISRCFLVSLVKKTATPQHSNSPKIFIQTSQNPLTLKKLVIKFSSYDEIN